VTHKQHQQLQQSVDKQTQRWKKAEQQQHSVLAYMSHLSALGLMFVLPIVGGAYLGHWLDGLSDGYSIQWTISLILLGIAIGAYNVYYLIQSRL